MLLGAIQSRRDDIRIGMIRGTQKSYGRLQWIEGDLDRSKEVVLVDDILNSGATIQKATKILSQHGYVVRRLLTLFQFEWGEGVNVAVRAGLEPRTLATVTRYPHTSIARSVRSDRKSGLRRFLARIFRCVCRKKLQNIREPDGSRNSYQPDDISRK